MKRTASYVHTVACRRVTAMGLQWSAARASERLESFASDNEFAVRTAEADSRREIRIARRMVRRGKRELARTHARNSLRAEARARLCAGLASR